MQAISISSRIKAAIRHFVGYSKKPRLLTHLCNRSATRFLSRVHHITHRVPTALRTLEKDRILVVAPHMDDEMIGAGGALAIHHKLGSELSLIFTSSCAGVSADVRENEIEAQVRQDEAKVAANFFDMHYFGTLGYPTGAMSLHEEAIGEDLAKIIEEWKPKTLYCPFPSDHHRDHQATALGLAHAIRLSGWTGEVWGYEIWSTLWPNTAVDISDVINLKKRSIECYPSQLQHMSYVDAALGLNRYRGLRVMVDSAEGYYVCNEREFIQLCDLLLKI